MDHSLRKKPARQQRRSLMIIFTYHAKELMQVDYQLCEPNLDVAGLFHPFSASRIYID